MFRVALVLVMVVVSAAAARAQVQVDLKFSRLQYIAYEPVLAKMTITNLAGRDIDLRDSGDQNWYGFEITDGDGRSIAPAHRSQEPPLHIAAGTSVTRKINLTNLFPIGEHGAYHVRANVFFADLNKFFYAPAKVFEVTSARPIWQRTVGDPQSNGVRTYSLMTNRFSDHTSLYVRVEDREKSLVYATYSLGKVIAFDEPHAEIDRDNRLHVLQCTAPRIWSYSVIDLDGRLLKRASYSQTRSTPKLRRGGDGTVTVRGGMPDVATSPVTAGKTPARLSDRSAKLPPED